jgi:ATP-dependent Clp protease protease subunit
MEIKMDTQSLILEIEKRLMEIEEHKTWMPQEVKFFGPSTRALAFFESIRPESALSLISQLHELDMQSSDTITLFLNTDGGNVTDSLAVYDCIRSLESPVVVVVTGICASGGLIILAAGDYRTATENSIFFYHQPIIDMDAVTSTSEMESIKDLYHCHQTQLDKIIKKRTKIKIKDWNKNFEGKTSYYFDCQKALEFGFIDDISIPEKKSIKIKEKKNGK